MTNKLSRMIGGLVSTLEKVIIPVSKALNAVGVATIMLISVFIVIDIILRAVFNSPITGGYELVEFSMVIVVFLAFSYTQVKKGHVSVELLTDHFPKPVQAILAIFTDLISLAFWGAIAYAGFAQAISQYEKNVVSGTLRLPVYPTVLVMAVGVTFFALVLIIDVFRDIQYSIMPRSYYESLKAKEKDSGNGGCML